MWNKLLKLVGLLALGAVSTFAQNSSRLISVINGQGKPVPGVNIELCHTGSSGYPCSNPATLVTSLSNSTPIPTSPNATTGADGSVTIYATPGPYDIQVTGQTYGATTWPNVIFSCDATVVGNCGTGGGGGGVTGTGVAGYIAQWTSSTNLGIAHMFDNGAGKLVITESVCNSGPNPWYDITCPITVNSLTTMAAGSSRATAGTITNGQNTLTVSSLIDFSVGMGVAVVPTVAYSSTCPLPMVGVITAINGSVLTLNRNASCTFSSVVDDTVIHEDGQAIQAVQAACAANTTMYNCSQLWPAGWYPTAYPLFSYTPDTTINGTTTVSPFIGPNSNHFTLYGGATLYAFGPNFQYPLTSITDTYENFTGSGAGAGGVVGYATATMTTGFDTYFNSVINAIPDHTGFNYASITGTFGSGYQFTVNNVSNLGDTPCTSGTPVVCTAYDGPQVAVQPLSGSPISTVVNYDMIYTPTSPATVANGQATNTALPMSISFPIFQFTGDAQDPKINEVQAVDQTGPYGNPATFWPARTGLHPTAISRNSAGTTTTATYSGSLGTTSATFAKFIRVANVCPSGGETTPFNGIFSVTSIGSGTVSWASPGGTSNATGGCQGIIQLVGTQQTAGCFGVGSTSFGHADDWSCYGAANGAGLQLTSVAALGQYTQYFDIKQGGTFNTRVGIQGSGYVSGIDVISGTYNCSAIANSYGIDFGNLNDNLGAFGGENKIEDGASPQINNCEYGISNKTGISLIGGKVEYTNGTNVTTTNNVWGDGNLGNCTQNDGDGNASQPWDIGGFPTVAEVRVTTWCIGFGGAGYQMGPHAVNMTVFPETARISGVTSFTPLSSISRTGTSVTYTAASNIQPTGLYTAIFGAPINVIGVIGGPVVNFNGFYKLSDLPSVPGDTTDAQDGTVGHYTTASHTEMGVTGVTSGVSLTRTGTVGNCLVTATLMSSISPTLLTGNPITVIGTNGTQSFAGTWYILSATPTVITWNQTGATCNVTDIGVTGDTLQTAFILLMEPQEFNFSPNVALQESVPYLDHAVINGYPGTGPLLGPQFPSIPDAQCWEYGLPSASLLTPVQSLLCGNNAGTNLFLYSNGGVQPPTPANTTLQASMLPVPQQPITGTPATAGPAQVVTGFTPAGVQETTTYDTQNSMIYSSAITGGTATAVTLTANTYSLLGNTGILPAPIGGGAKATAFFHCTANCTGDTVTLEWSFEVQGGMSPNTLTYTGVSDNANAGYATITIENVGASLQTLDAGPGFIGSTVLVPATIVTGNQANWATSDMVIALYIKSGSCAGTCGTWQLDSLNVNAQQ